LGSSSGTAWTTAACTPRARALPGVRWSSRGRAACGPSRRAAPRHASPGPSATTTGRARAGKTPKLGPLAQRQALPSSRPRRRDRPAPQRPFARRRDRRAVRCMAQTTTERCYDAGWARRVELLDGRRECLASASAASTAGTLRPASTAATSWRLTPARAASSACVNPQSRRRLRSNDSVRIARILVSCPDSVGERGGGSWDALAYDQICSAIGAAIAVAALLATAAAARAAVAPRRSLAPHRCLSYSRRSTRRPNTRSMARARLRRTSNRGPRPTSTPRQNEKDPDALYAMKLSTSRLSSRQTGS